MRTIKIQVTFEVTVTLGERAHNDAAVDVVADIADMGVVHGSYGGSQRVAFVDTHRLWDFSDCTTPTLTVLEDSNNDLP